MAKFAGWVGYVTQEESSPGVWAPVDIPKWMTGDVIRNAYSPQGGDKVNENITLNHRVSLVGDAYAFGNFQYIRWIEHNGMKWEVVAVEFQRPRIIVTLGGPWYGSEQ